MKVFLIGLDGPMSEILVRLVDNNINIVGVCTRKKSFFKIIKSNISYLLKKYYLYPNKNYIYYDIKKYNSLIKISKKNKLPLLWSSDLRTSTFEKRLKELEPDLIIMASFNRLIPNNIIKIPKFGFVNIHPGKLPENRGSTPLRWALINGISESFVTAHFIDTTLDTGDIILEQKVEITLEDNLGTLTDKTDYISIDLVCKVYKLFLNNKVIRIKQEDRTLYNKKFGITQQKISLNNNFNYIKNVCQALQPRSSAIILINGIDLCIWKIYKEELNKEYDLIEIGEIVELSPNIKLRCKDSVLVIESFLDRGNIIKSNTALRRYNLNN